MDNLAKEIIELGQNKQYDRLDTVIAQCETRRLSKAAVEMVGRSNASIFWNFMLVGFKAHLDADATKRFSVIMAVLDQLNKVEVPSKQTYDLITRLYIELPKLKSSELIKLAEYCIDSLRNGDPKCTGWKELYPEVMLLLNEMPKVIYDGMTMTGSEYKALSFRNLLSYKWPETVLTSIASMFRSEMPISKDEKMKVLRKLCENLQKLQPLELPALAYQLFSLCNTAALITIPILSLNRYFHRNYYARIMDTSSEQSNPDSIEEFSDKELREAQETILMHLSDCNEHKINERDVVNQFRALAFNPRYILTPFLISALLTMSNVNRYFDSIRLSTCSTLPFLRTIIKNNERERELCEKSAWCRITLEQSVIDLKKILTILIEQSKEGADVVTAGIVGLSFVLLKATQNEQLNNLGIHFLEEFLKKRHIFGSGIVKNLKEFLFADQSAPQYAECLTRLSTTNTMTISECLGSIKEILDFFLLIPGQHAMRMMTFVVPLMKMSTVIRDYFIEVLCKAMHQSDLNTRQMAVHGFCLILKQLRTNQSSRSGRANYTQLSISGYSLMSQSFFNSQNNPQMHFDRSVLEIIGTLRKCFNQTYEIKEVLYDGLTNAMQMNAKLTPHLLQFFDLHFREFFEMTDQQLTIKFQKCVVEQNSGGIVTVQIRDHVGRLLHFMGQCILICEQTEQDYEVCDLKEFFSQLIERATKIHLEDLGLAGTLTSQMASICGQYLNLLEGLISYRLNVCEVDDQSVEDVLKLFDHHKECSKKLHDLSAAKKAPKKKVDDTQNEPPNLKLMAPVSFKPVNIWDLKTIKGLLDIICREPHDSNALWQKKSFVRYLLTVTGSKVEGMQTAPEYKQVKYSRSNFQLLCDISKIVLNHFARHTVAMVEEGDSVMAHHTAECLRQCLITAKELYCRKFSEFLTLTCAAGKGFECKLINILQNILDDLLDLLERIDVDQNSEEIPLKLMQCLEILYENVKMSEQQANECYKWLHNFCKNRNVDSGNMSFILKLLFNQHVKTQIGPFFGDIAIQIEQEAGQILEAPLEVNEKYTAITAITAESCAIYLCNSIRKQIEDVEYFIMKTKSFHAKMKISGEDDRSTELMQSTERRICSQLIFICNACVHLANTDLPLGSCMDNFIRVLLQYYICLSNVTKYFIHRNKTIAMSHQHTKFEHLVKVVGKPLPLKIYAMISHIEENIFDNSKESKRKKTDAKVEKAKVMRDTKFIPKLILRIENFNKFVTCLSKKTQHDLSKLLHMGTVRDFRIKTDELREIIDKTFSEQIDIDEDDLENEQEESDDNNDDAAEHERHSLSANDNEPEREPSSSSSGQTSSNEAILKENEGEELSEAQALQNLAVINKRARKRKQNDNDASDEGQTNKRLTRNQKKSSE